jgi:hypothetical protein
VDNNSDLVDLVVTGIPRTLRGDLDSRVTGDSCDHLDIQPRSSPALGQRISQGANFAALVVVAGWRRHKERVRRVITATGSGRVDPALLPTHNFSGNEIKAHVQTRVNL